MTRLAPFYYSWYAVSGLFKTIGSSTGLWAPATVAAVKIDFNSFLTAICLVVMFFAVLIALVVIFWILATSHTRIIRAISNVNPTRWMIVVALASLVMLTCMFYWVIFIILINLAYLLLTNTLYICGHAIKAVQYFGEIAGGNQRAIAN